MVYGHWGTLPSPIIGLAPMDGVTDASFRYIVAKYGKPDVIITEFTSVEGIRAGAERLLDDFIYDPLERPVIAQLFGADPTAFFLGAVTAAALGFDGVDINMGCPAKNVTQRGAGASLILDPLRAQEIIRQAKAGCQAWYDGITLAEAGIPERIIALIQKRRELFSDQSRRHLPVSVKTRIGYTSDLVHEWIPQLLEAEPAAITLHGRTFKQLYSGTADWEAIGKAAAIIHQQPGVRIVGNGDIISRADAEEKSRLYATDGALIGRASFGNPWIFHPRPVDRNERKNVALEHARVLNDYFQERGFVKIRKHLLDYFKGTPDSREFRLALMRVENLEDVERLLN